MITDKPRLRAEVRAARAAFGARPIAVPLPFLALLAPGLTVATYLPIRGEADPGPLATAALAAGCRLALPHVIDRATPLRFLAWEAGAALHPGPLGLSQPHGDAEELAPDVILTPLVAFDAALNRLGQGAGYYDRAFTAVPEAQRIGIAYSVQQVAAIPCEPWDVPLHAVVTEQGWLTP